MASDPKDKAPDSAGTARDARLADALRANLRRRKAQARNQNGAPARKPHPSTEAATGEEPGNGNDQD